MLDSVPAAWGISLPLLTHCWSSGEKNKAAFFGCFFNLKARFVEYLSRRGSNVVSRIPLKVALEL